MDTYPAYLSNPLQTIDFNSIPADGLEGLDKINVLNVAKIMLSLKYPLKAIKWSVVKRSDLLIVNCEFDGRMSFSLRELSAVEQVNWVLIQDVVVYPSGGNMILSARITPAEESMTFTVDTIKIIRSKIDNNKRKRISTDVDDGAEERLSKKRDEAIK